jgi:sortase A
MRSLSLSQALCVALLAAGITLMGWGLYIPAKAAVAQILLERAWTTAGDTGVAPPPWPWADTRPIARVRTADNEHEAIVLAGAHGRSLAFGPGHIDGTSLPGGIGHSVIAAHRDTHFAFLRDMIVGQEIIVERPDGSQVRHVIVDIQTIDVRTETIALNHDVDMLTLVTCYPFENWEPGGPLRYVVHAVAVQRVLPSA